MKTLAQDTIIANARFFGGNVDLVPKQVYPHVTKSTMISWFSLQGIADGEKSTKHNIYKNAKTEQLFVRRWQWVWAPWWTPRRFSFLSPAQTRPLPSTRCPFKHWCHDDINDGFTLCSGDWGGSLPHVDCVSFPAASKHDDHCRRGCKIPIAMAT